MSQGFLLEEQFLCSICLDVFSNPVSTPCGHSFCLRCIDHYWDGSRPCHCPLCNKVFQKKPDLHINRTLREITELFQRMKAGATTGAVPGSVPHRPGQLPCHLFEEMRARFPRSSLCEGHPRGPPPPVPRRHSLSGPADSLDGPLCPHHHQCLELFCRTDQTCICVLCAEDEHRAHITIPAKRECIIKKSQLEITEVEMLKLIQERQKKVEEIKSSPEDI